MTPVSKNEDLRLRDEENNGQEQEVALPSSNENEMAFHRPEEEKEPDDKDKEPSGNTNTNRWRPWSRSRTLNAFLAAAGVGVVVGTVSVISLASSSSKTINVSNQVAMVVPEGFVEVGPGQCRTAANTVYPYVGFFGDMTADSCGDKCKCVENYAATNAAVTFRGMDHNPAAEGAGCLCLVDGPVSSAELNPLKAAPCSASTVVINRNGSGEITFTFPKTGWTCYKRGEANSKAGKTKAGKAEDK